MPGKPWLEAKGNGPEAKPERTYLMGDSKGRKEKAKGQKQHEAKQAKAEKQKQDKKNPKTT